MVDEPLVRGTGVLLAKVRSTERLLGVSGRVGIEPLRAPVAGAERSAFALDGSPQWFKVETEAESSPWDQAHARVAAQLGVDESDVLFVEPDLVHSIYRDSELDRPGGMALGADCQPVGQDGTHGKPTGAGFAWHLDKDHSQLGLARSNVPFAEPRTVIAHIDTGWSPHETQPNFLDLQRQRNFVSSDGNAGNAQDPDNDVFLMDNSGHGTGTLSILAGATVSVENAVLGGAAEARVVPIRVADRVVLLRTSALARAIMYASDIRAAVATLSMGGVPSKAWAEAIDDAYERGLCLAAAAGNRVGELPPRVMVYPARYARVIAVTGVMSDGSPYENLDGTTLESCFGPDSAMGTAMAAFSPNIPWAKFGCRTISRLDGEGTSAATPQVAAAAALWIEQYKAFLPEDWRRVEAVRNALFSSAKKGNRDRFGNGILQAQKALGVAPNLQLERSARSKHGWAILRMLTGLFLDGDVPPREEMLNLEMEQLWLTNSALHALVPDPASVATLSTELTQQVVEAVLEDPNASAALCRHLRGRSGQIGRTSSVMPRAGTPEEPPRIGWVTPPAPPHRRLRVYAKDPTLATAFATSSVGQVALEIPWESVEATETGFSGKYLEIVDDAIEPATKGVPTPGLDHPFLLAEDGWAPSPGHMQFHQQMVYAVASKTIEHFEIALGRPVLWSHRRVPGKPNDDSVFVPRLTLRPHALRTANAYYSPEESSLLFGYFVQGDGVSQVPTFPVYTCLSYDIIAHETTHAILDGMYRRFAEPTNPDVLAFHEAFADVVALLQSFDLTELLEHQIGSSRGDLRADTLLGKLAVELGHAARGREALRSAIGRSVNGRWVPSTPDPNALRTLTAPHDRGAILVAAVFDALIAIYERRTADLFRLATGGTGRLPDGAIHPDLTARLASEASKSARHLLQMCIRALDYLPPVDITFFDFLRALMTADAEYVPDDRYDYRVAVVEAFTKRGIVPGESDAEADGLRSLSADSIRWTSFDPSEARGRTGKYYRAIIEALGEYAERCVYVTDREKLFTLTRQHRARLSKMFRGAFDEWPQFRTGLGLEPGPIEVHTLRRAMRARPSGKVEPEVIVSLTQSRRTPADKAAGTPEYRRLGGATIIVNLAEAELPRYRIVKPVTDPDRQRATAAFHAYVGADALRTLYLAPHENQFALLHQLVEES